MGVSEALRRVSLTPKSKRKKHSSVIVDAVDITLGRHNISSINPSRLYCRLLYSAADELYKASSYRNRCKVLIV
eukprot:scaffold4021_cov115-Skeletonema_dohrnii-CCMP3373.AAC.6